jgi:hypothetical protein
MQRDKVNLQPLWRTVPELAGPLRAAAQPVDRLRALRAAGESLHERFMSEPVLPWLRTVALMPVPYPAWYAFSGVRAQRLLSGGMVQLMARVVLLQFLDFEGRRRTLLFNPHDIERGGETPFFKRMTQGMPSFARDIVAPVRSTVPLALQETGVGADGVDYIVYDHLHTQDLRVWLGGDDAPGLFPNARLLVHHAEWDSVQGLLANQADWYCPGGTQGVPHDRVLRFDGSIQLGPGLALVHTSGHTAGNCSIVYRAPDGVRVSSENGVSSDSWSPEHSRTNAIRRYARATGAEVVLNGNTQESSVDQYLSMVLEKAIAGPARDHPFGNVVPSSECTPHWLFPGAPISHLWGDTSFGTPSIHHAKEIK